MIKISFDSQIFSSQVYGGISRYYAEIATRISKISGTQVNIVAPMYINSYIQQIPSNLITGFKSPFKPGSIKVTQKSASFVLCDLMLRKVSPNIIHETYFFKYPLGPSSAKRVITLYDMIHEKFPSDFKNSRQLLKHKAQAVKRADHIICISESTKRDAIELLGVSSEKISVIHLGFDLMLSGSVVFDLHDKVLSKPFLLYVGNRAGYKNFFNLLKAVAESTLIKSEFNLVCFGGGFFSTKEIDMIKMLNLSVNQVIQLGGNDSVLSQLYKKAFAFIFPSQYEGFGIPPLEAMSFNCPVICSDKSSIPEVVGDAGAYFDPNDIGSIKNTIERVALSCDLRERLIKKGQERIKNFSWDSCASNTLDVYKSIL